MSLGAQRTVTSRIGERLKGRSLAAALSTFAFSVHTHAILLIVSGSFVLETSSSCGLVVPMRALPRPMGRHCVPLIFAVDVVVVVVVVLRLSSTFSPSDAYARRRRNTRRFRSDDTIEKMLPLLLALSPCPRAPAARPFVRRALKLCKRCPLLGSRAMRHYVWTIIRSLGKPVQLRTWETKDCLKMHHLAG